MENWTFKINLNFLIWLKAQYMRLKLINRNYRFRILTNYCTRIALRRFNYELTIHVWPPAVRGHVNHSPGTWLACADFID